jgi:hypothetical protein
VFSLKFQTVLIGKYGVVETIECDFRGNTAKAFAGGVAFVDGGYWIATRDRYTSNVAVDGGVLYARNSPSGIHFFDCSFESNSYVSRASLILLVLICSTR